MLYSPKVPPGAAGVPSRRLTYLLILGLYLTLRGYHSLDGDQAYRLPLLLHGQDPALYAADPFVRAFDTFNPHRGSLLVLSMVTGVAGLSVGLLVAFLATFWATCRGIDRLASCVWPVKGGAVGVIALILALTAKAGNIGTNHLFEAMVLDRLIALAFAWNALAAMVDDPDRGSWPSALMLGAAAFIHPSLGLQIGLVVSGTWAIWAVFSCHAGVSPKKASLAIAATWICLIPGLIYNLAPGGSLIGGLPTEEFRILAAELQSPQHMLPHLWRMPQWLAFGGYLTLAGLALLFPPEGTDSIGDEGILTSVMGTEAGTGRPQLICSMRPSPARVRLMILLFVVIAWLAAAWVAVEGVRNLHVTIFQPFRMATLARGLALVLVAGRVVDLWLRGGAYRRLRAVLIAVGLTGDWMFVVVAAAEVGATLGERLSDRAGRVLFAATHSYGLYFLSRHDTESGHWLLLTVIAGAAAAGLRNERRAGRVQMSVWKNDVRMGILSHRLAMSLAWVVPVLALVAGLMPAERSPLGRSLIARCRFVEVPVDDVERLAAWCRENTPRSAIFVGPPGPKTFRLWSRRSLAFNRAGSPYHGAGLADWFARFQDHVDVHKLPAAFVNEYLAGRAQLEARYHRFDGEALASLAVRQGADHVIARSDLGETASLQLLHAEGGYAAYSVISPLLSQRQR